MSSAMDQTDDAWEVNVGWEVVTADGERLGKVEGVHEQHLIVSTTSLTPTMLFVPASAVTEVETEMVYLRVAMADVLRHGWELPPEFDEMQADARTGTAAMGEDMQYIVGFAMVAIVTLAALFLIVSWSFGPLDTAIAFLSVLGVAAIGVWAFLVCYRIVRA